jgi:hypothetical protein
VLDSIITSEITPAIFLLCSAASVLPGIAAELLQHDLLRPHVEQRSALTFAVHRKCLYNQNRT